VTSRIAIRIAKFFLPLQIFWLSIAILMAGGPAEGFIHCAHAAVQIQDRQGIKLATRDLNFVDEAGKSVNLDSYFNAGRPVVLALVYFDCPGACTVLVNEFVSTLKGMALFPGASFDVIVASFDPSDTPHLAAAKKQGTVDLFGRPETSSGWHFLTGTAPAIASLTSQLGFEYEKDQKTGVFSHPSALFVLTPDGTLSRVLPGVKFSQALLRLALYDAAQGKVGTYFNRLLTLCAVYLPHGGWLDSPERWFLFIGSLILASLFLVMGYRARKQRGK